MRIAFDIDNTLIPQRDEFPVEPSVPFPLLRIWFRESLREGTRRLLRELRARGCDIWLYTTSGRESSYLRSWFLLLGVPLGGVVNYHRHEALMRAGRCPNCSKYPPAFGIDLLVDDSDGVVLEGRQHGFDVLLINPEDQNWEDRVLAAIDERHRVSRR
jgi:hypothetical protein